ncbi:hypothetical protein VP01_10662g1, partial [Puccinia sorghi]
MDTGPGPPFNQPPRSPSTFHQNSSAVTIQFVIIRYPTMSTVNKIVPKNMNTNLDPLPFENAQGDCPVPYLAPARSETQDTWLGPSQPNLNNRPCVAMFYEPNKAATNHPASGGNIPSPQHRHVVNSVANQAVAPQRRLILKPPQQQNATHPLGSIELAQAEEGKNSPGPNQPKRPINLEYFVFICAANNLISIPSSSNNKATGGPKDWEK